jgi:hypothetical protein
VKGMDKDVQIMMEKLKLQQVNIIKNEWLVFSLKYFIIDGGRKENNKSSSFAYTHERFITS